MNIKETILDNTNGELTSLQYVQFTKHFKIQNGICLHKFGDSTITIEPTINTNEYVISKLIYDKILKSTIVQSVLFLYNSDNIIEYCLSEMEVKVNENS